MGTDDVGEVMSITGTAKRKLKLKVVERGIYEKWIIYPDGRETLLGFYGRYEEYGEQKYTARQSSVTKARKARQEAIAFVNEQKRNMGQIRPTLDATDTLILDFLKEKRGKPIYREYKRFAEWWTARFKKRPVLTLEPKEVRLAIADLEAEQRSGSTIANYVGFLHHFMVSMVKPAAWVVEFWSQIDIPKRTPKRKRPAYTEQQEQLLCEHLSPFDLIFVRLAVLLGIRGGQMVSLRWEYISWPLRQIDLPKFKRHAPRTMPLVDETEALLKCLWTGHGCPDRGWVFPDTTFAKVPPMEYANIAEKVNAHPLEPGKKNCPRRIAIRQLALNYGVTARHIEAIAAGTQKGADHTAVPHMNYHNWYTRHFRPAIVAAGLSGLGLDFHSLRHTWFSRLGAKTKARILQVLGGVSDIRLVERYTDVFDPALREAMEWATQFNPGGGNKEVSRPGKKKRPVLRVVD